MSWWEPASLPSVGQVSSSETQGGGAGVLLQA